MRAAAPRRYWHRIALCVMLFMLTTNLIVCQTDGSNDNCFSDDSDSHCVKSLDRVVKQDTLVFVTPWNKIGYELVQNFHNKVTMISPVWFYHEKNKQSGKFEFQGRQDIDRDFVQKMRSRNADIKILPRVYVSGSEEEFRWFLQESVYTYIFDQLAEIAEQEGLDGYVFDFPLLNRLKYSGPVKKMLDSIKSKFPNLFRVITFAGYRISLTKSIEQIQPFLDIFQKILVCTYDYPNKTFDRWLSPIAWFEENGEFYSEVADKLKVSRNRFILGLPFYGYIVDTNTYGARQIQIEEYDTYLTQILEPCQHEGV